MKQMTWKNEGNKSWGKRVNMNEFEKIFKTCIMPSTMNKTLHMKMMKVLNGLN